MNGNKLFLDTNIVLYLLNGDRTLATLLNKKQLYLSVISELELLGFKGITSEELETIKTFLSKCKIINLNQSIKEETIYLRKTTNLKLPDSIIIATALYLDLPLVTSDAEFKKAKNLMLIHYKN